MTQKKLDWSKLWKTEDWLAVWIGFIVIIIACIAVLTKAFDFSALKFSTWSLGEAQATNATPLGQQLASGAFWGKLALTFGVLGLLFTIGVKFLGTSAKVYSGVYRTFCIGSGSPPDQCGIHPQPLS